MTIMSEIQSFARQHRLSPDAQIALCGLCMCFIDRAVAELRGEENAGSPPTIVEELKVASTLAGITQWDASFSGEEVAETRPAGRISLLPPTIDQPAIADAIGAETLDLGPRYEDLGVLGMGGMGEVRRVFDRDLGRRLAMKILKSNLLEKSRSVARFIEEAQIGAQLQHPGLVPVYEMGRLRNGRPFFTMREVQGREFGEVIREVHTASEGGDWRQAESGWTFRRLLSAFVWVCETVGYAHSKGVVHRDLKPSNLLIGSNEETLVLDWGVAKVLQPHGEMDTVQTARSRDQEQATQIGAVTGTPAYMPPEQAHGTTAQINARSDIYALGAILYTILSGQAPYKGPSAMAILVAVSQGPPPPLVEISPRTLPKDLIEVCERAMSRNPDDRYASAKDMANALNDWLDGTRRHDLAIRLVHESLTLEHEAALSRRRAEQLRREGEAALVFVPPYAPEQDKYPGWTKEDEALQQFRHANLQSLEADQRLQAALAYVPDLPEAHTQLARRYLAEHRDAEARQLPDAMMHAEIKLRAHVEALPLASVDRQRFTSYLRGIGALTLWTDPPGAEVHLYRYVEKNRRFHEVFDRVLGRTPIQEVALEAGSYLCVLKREGFEPVRYPIFIERQLHWDGIRPGDQEPFPITLPPTGNLHPSEMYIPAGWFLAGGDSNAPGSVVRRCLWVDGFVISRFTVTNSEYIWFLDDLMTENRVEDALRFAPRERPSRAHELGALIYAHDTTRARFSLRANADGDAWLPDHPVVMVDWFGASAYCAHLADKYHKGWQLPTEWHWEKAARGVDGRFHPWGNGFDPSWCCMSDSHRDRPRLAIVDSFPVDQSPYGVRGMAGNVREWCANPWSKDGPDAMVITMPHTPQPMSDAAYRVRRGGSWSYYAQICRSADRVNDPPTARYNYLGFRPARPI